ncbi:MAG: 4Fe-4S binding protein [Proteobacteria bacterium]|nr:4Fe-4S binding protein [Pseudomonadota bacterium]
MSYAKGKHKRSKGEKIFLVFFLPTIVLGYTLYKCHELFVDLGMVADVRSFYFLEKHPAFWYALVYTGLVCFIAAQVVIKNRSPYKRGKNPKLSKYQRSKFISIFLVQLIFFFLIPFVIIPLSSGDSLLFDRVVPTNLEAYVYVSKAFKSWGGLFYVFILIPISVWFFGKRYCSWFCACGNLAETVGVTTWGKKWVKFKTPTGDKANRMEVLQVVLLVLGLAYGFLLFFDMLKLFTAESLLMAGKYYQDIAVDLVFGALIGVGAYPFMGTRIWCRYGCPLAKGMEFFGRYAGSKFQVKANESCKGLDLCSQTCPMGIDVASYAHKDKKPILGSFSLKSTLCIGCGGCIDICPKDALSFSG